MIYVIVGPTCSHKTKTAVALAEKLDAPIISGDAFQIYKDMDIGTSKIRKNEPGYERHYLLDIITPDKSFSVMEYQKIGRKCLDELLKNNKDVIIVGGTGLYIRALLYDYEFIEEERPDNPELEKLTNHELHLLLESLDKEEVLKIHENNRKRMIRAITLMQNSNLVKSEHLSKQNHDYIYDDVKMLFINPNRDTLYKEINERVVQMMKEGLVEEVKNLLNKYDLSLTARQGIGYKEVISYLNDEISYDECVELIQKRTRNYAKRQVTFFKHQFKNINIYLSGEELLYNIWK